MSENLSHIAVLTGDIIGSTQMPPEDLERAFDALSASAEVQADWHGESLHFTRQRGDGWQVRLARPELALRSALAFRAALRSEGKEFSTYIATAEGLAGASFPNNDLNAVSDRVFIESGRLLDEMKSYSYSLNVKMSHTSTGAIGAAFIFADHISQSWTPSQAAAILPGLIISDPPNNSEIARTLGKSRQAVTKAQNGAGLEAILLALHVIEAPEAKDD